MAFLALGILAIAIVLPIYLLFAQIALKARISVLEARLGGVAELPEVEAGETAEPAVIGEAEPKTPPQATPVPAKRPRRETPKAYVFRAETWARFSGWMQKNWFYAVAAVSFALAGVFLVQYGVEKGLLTPAMRVLAALVFGWALVGAGEYIRRRAGDENGTFAFLPSALSGAGLVSMFAAVLAARLMYGLIGPNAAFAGLAMVGALAVMLGWFYGPLLAIVGVSGALAAPFLVGGDSSSADMLQFYFAGIAAVALMIDSYKHWAWLSALGLIGAYGAAFLLFAGTDDAVAFVAFGILVAAAAVILPERHLVPRQRGAMLSQVSTVRVEGQEGMTLPEFPTRVAGGAFIASVLLLGWAYAKQADTFWLVTGALSLMVLGAVVWMRRAPALGDLVFVALAMVLAVIPIEGIMEGGTHSVWMQSAERESIDFPSPIVTILLGGALLAGLLLAWRSWRNGAYPRFSAGVAAAYAPLVAVELELFWSPSSVLGAANWAIYLAIVASVMTALAERFGRLDHEDRTRPALFALSAMTMLAFMATVLLGGYTLTLAIAVMVAGAAWLGRRFDLPLMDRYMQAGAIVVSWRLVLDPGLDWAVTADLLAVSGTFIGVILLLVAAYRGLRKGAGADVIVVMESAIWSLGAVFFSVLVWRYFRDQGIGVDYVRLSLLGFVWLVVASSQLYRLQAGGPLRALQKGLSVVYGAIGLIWLGLSVFFTNPLDTYSAVVAGPYVFDTLAVAYALPALLIGGVALRMDHLQRRLRKLAGFGAAGLAGLYIGLEIRRWWQGDDLSVYGVKDGELYSYTIAMLAVGVVLLVLAYMHRSPMLRRLLLIAVGVTAAKVFLIDMAGLSGLLRVASFFVVGLVVGLMALVNRFLQKNEAERAEFSGE